MPKYKIRLPSGIGRINAQNQKDAIDNAIKIFRIMFDKIINDGSIYSIPDICSEVRKKNTDGLEMLGNEVPIKPRNGKRVKRRR